jgi:two-component system CheB/CheR fusion protein
VQALYEDILISVTEFFRDPEAFEALANTVIPSLMGERRQRQEIRVWVPGCSTGEEVYSLVMTLLEALGDRTDEIALQVFATDISEHSLGKARTGVYPMSISQSVSAERLRRFFVRNHSAYQVNKRVRDLCIFARHDLARDPPFSRLDLISCRNVLIYLGPALQERVMSMFHYALKPNAHLLLGTSETVGRSTELFHLVDARHKIYQRRPAATRLMLELPRHQIETAKTTPSERPEPVSDFDLQREADRLVLSKYAPPGVIVDDDMNILQFRGEMNPFLAPQPGTATLNLLRMLRKELTVEVRTGVAAAHRQNKTVRRERIPFASDGSTLVSIEVIPLRRLARMTRRYLVLFEPVREQSVPAKGRKSGDTVAQSKEVERLRLELTASREYLQGIVDDHEAAQEELRSAAEEIQSSNEELQSTNEELETAKEELQSTNEELNTVNEELQARNMQLAQVGNDLLNLLANVNMPIVILGSDHRIRRFTPAAEKALNLIPSDVGRPIRDINLPIPAPDLEKALADVADTLIPKVIDVTDPDSKAYSLRIRPYRTEENRIDGIVMVFIDIDTAVPAAEAFAQMPALTAVGDPVARASLLIAQEEERRRLAHELHDELNQRLALLEFSVQSLEMRRDPEAVFRQLGEVRRSVAALSDDLRRVAYQLHPAIIDDLGLVPALKAYADEFTSREGIEVSFSDHDVPADLPSGTALAVFRIVQEGLRNIAKHSGARHASVTLNHSNGRLEVVLRDTGSGFHPESVRTSGLGMRGMRERVHLVSGTIQWKSKPGDGTQVIVSIPVIPEAGKAGPPHK